MPHKLASAIATQGAHTCNSSPPYSIWEGWGGEGRGGERQDIWQQQTEAPQTLKRPPITTDNASFLRKPHPKGSIQPQWGRGPQQTFLHGSLLAKNNSSLDKTKLKTETPTQRIL